MMRLGWRDVIATVALVAIVIPYVGYLTRGSVPFIEDPRGMAATGLVLGAVAALAAGRRAFTHQRTGPAASALGVAAACIGFAALVWPWSGTVAEVLLAGFMVSIAMTWAVAMTADTGPAMTRQRRRLAGHR